MSHHAGNGLIPFNQPGRALVIQGDALRLPLPDGSVDLAICSPPYFALRSYSTAHKAQEIGSEPTPAAYLEALWAATAELVRVLKPTGSIFVDLGDKYSGNEAGYSTNPGKSGDMVRRKMSSQQTQRTPYSSGIPAKSLMLLPERYRIGCVDHLGLIARAVIVHDKPNCLSGGTMVYARCKGRPLAIKVHDLCRAYQPEDVQLWNGQRWTQVLWWQPTGRHPDAEASYKAIRAARRRSEEPVIGGDLEIELRSGERIGCTREHRWPTERGLFPASELIAGDVLQTAPLPEGEATPAALDDEMVGWFVGLYIAEGSRSEGMIQIAGHVKELERFKRLRELAEAFHAKCSVYATGGNASTINLAGRFLDAILATYVGGRTAKDKHLAPKAWQRSNRFLSAVLDGYLSGDGHRLKGVLSGWTVSFTNNDALAADLRTLGARLGYSVRLRRVTHTGFGKEWPGWRGTITTPDRRRQPDTEIVAIRQSRARQFWDIGVEDDPHLFALTSGVLTHNSLPESVRDRVRRSHEDWVHLVKQPRYYSALDEIREDYTARAVAQADIDARAGLTKGTAGRKDTGNGVERLRSMTALNPLGKLPGSVWRIPSEPLRLPDHLGVDHYAAFASEWPRRLVLAFSPPGICVDCGQGRAPVVDKRLAGIWHEGVDEDSRHHDSRDQHKHNWMGAKDAWGHTEATILGYACSCCPFTDHPGSGEPSGPHGVAGNDPRAGNGYEGTGAGQGWGGKGGLGDRPKVGPWREYHLDGWKSPPTRPATVLDCFSGTGTVPMVARALGRIGIGVDLSFPYCRAARWRIHHDAGKAISRTWVERQGSLL